MLPQNCPELPACPPWAMGDISLSRLYYLFFSLLLFAHSELLLPFVSWIMFSSPSQSLHLLVSQTYWHASVVRSQHSPRMNHVAASMQELSFMINTAIHKSVFSYARKHGAGKDKAFHLQFDSNRGPDLCVCVCVCFRSGPDQRRERARLIS